MYRLLVLASLLVLTNCGSVRVPKIYNALITTDDNLSPSRAIPVIEPVLKATSHGIGFQPVFVEHTFEFPRKFENNNPWKNYPAANPFPGNVKYNDNIKSKSENTNLPMLQLDSFYPLAIDPYNIPYSLSTELLFPTLPTLTTLPYYHQYNQPILPDLGHFNTDNNKKEEPPAPATNFKKNPEIPDVPPPPLPMKERKQRAA